MMTTREYIKEQQISTDFDRVKIFLLKSVAELMLFPEHEHLKNTIKYIAVLANSFHVELNSSSSVKNETNDKELLYKISEIIQNKHGYNELLPETLGIILAFAKRNNLKLIF